MGNDVDMENERNHPVVTTAASPPNARNIKKPVAVVALLVLGLGLPSYWLLSRREQIQEAPSAPRGTIFYEKYSPESGDGGLYVYDHARKSSARIPDSPWGEYDIKGGMIAWVSGAGPSARDLYLGPLPGKSNKIHTADRRILEVELSPDLKNIAYIKHFFEEKREELWRIDADGSDNVLVSSEIPPVYFMEWVTPDRVYFAEGSSEQNENYPKGLLSIEVNGGRISNLPVPNVAISNISDVSFAQDGSRVAIAARGRLYITDIEKADTQEVSSTGDASLSHPMFAPDNTRVAYLHSSLAGGSDIFVFDPLSGESTRILDEPPAELVEFEPSWGPLSSHAVFDIAGWVSDTELLYVFVTFEDDRFRTELILLDTTSKRKTAIDSAEEIRVLGLKE